MVDRVDGDVLRLVFEEIVRYEVDDELWPVADYDATLATAAFTLAAVCRRWRAIALEAAVLWTYFAFPHNPTGHALRLSLLHTRSKDAAIDIVFRCGSEFDPDGSKMPARRLEFESHEILRVVGGLCARWRHVILDLPESIAWTADLSNGVPLLETLSLTEARTMKYLPVAPRLRRLYLNPRTVDQLFTLPALTHLVLYSSSATLYLALVAATSQQLTELTLVENLENMEPPISAQGSQICVFPILRSLTVDDARWLGVIRAPSLQKLTMSCQGFQETLQMTCESLKWSRIYSFLILWNRMSWSASAHLGTSPLSPSSNQPHLTQPLVTKTTINLQPTVSVGCSTCSRRFGRGCICSSWQVLSLDLTDPRNRLTSLTSWTCLLSLQPAMKTNSSRSCKWWPSFREHRAG